MQKGPYIRNYTECLTLTDGKNRDDKYSRGKKTELSSNYTN